MRRIPDPDYVGKDTIEFNTDYSLRTNVYMELARVISKMAKCTRRQVGAVLTNKQGAILAMGYNGTPHGMVECTHGGCPRGKETNRKEERPFVCFGAHAEMNCLIHAAQHGRLSKEMILYITLQPCEACLPHLINAGVRKIYFSQGYHVVKYPNYFIEMCFRANVETVRMEDMDPLLVKVPQSYADGVKKGEYTLLDVLGHVKEHLGFCIMQANSVIKPELKRLVELIGELF